MKVVVMRKGVCKGNNVSLLSYLSMCFGMTRFDAGDGLMSGMDRSTHLNAKV